ncbi:Replication-relaxation [Williamsia sterculiae]|uniref:Replication-relaxation n=2 Tax=Williamsia sterculiae TaxID=1344003 RepID=A0A1N7GHH4_9NOCA|nr:Replication-relaxation [Williamsia sterculiae]
MLTTGQIYELVFRSSKSRTTVDRQLRYLRDDGLVTRLERRLAGGANAGSGQWVYRLSASGWRIYRTGPYHSRRSTDFHALTVADTYIRVLNAVDAGWLRDDFYAEVEDEAYRSVRGASIRPDMYLELANLERRKQLYVAVEVDKGTENRPAIWDKLDRYVHALTHDDGVYEVFPVVWFLVGDGQRAEQLKRWIRERQPRYTQYFRVGLVDDFPDCLR